MINYYMLKFGKLFALLCLLPMLPLAAQEESDTIYQFRFVPGNDMFYVPFQDNADELARLEKCVETYKTEITAGKIPVLVDSHSSTVDIAKIRANRVKSELIIRRQFTEECFITHNHADDGDYVTVRIVAPIRSEVEEKAVATAPQEPAVPAKQEPVEAEPVKEEPEKPAVAVEQPVANASAQMSQPVEVPATEGYRFALRANLLRWATLTPDLGIEWRINPSWGVLVNGSWTSWSWNNKDRRYALWEVSPEVRYYMGKEKRGYLGAMYKAGGFNYKLSATGKQGDLMGGGITGGYQLRLNKALLLDFTLALGCLHADYEKYGVVDGVRVRQGNETKNWWGPVNAGVTLVWNLK